MKRLSALLGICALALLLSPPARAQQEDPALRCVPADALFYTSIDPKALRQFWLDVRGSRFVRELRRVGVAEAGEASVRDAENAFTQGLGMVAEAAAGPIALAVSDAPFGPERFPAALAVIPTASEERAQAVAIAMRLALNADEAPSTKRQHEGVTMTLYGDDEEPFQPCYAVVGGRMLIATHSSWLQQSLDVLAGRAKGLAANADFERVRAQLAAMGPSHALMWLDQKRYTARVFELMKETAAPSKGEDETDAPAGDTAAGEKPKGEGEEGAVGEEPGNAGSPIPDFDPEVFLKAMQPVLDAFPASGARVTFSREGVTVDGIYLVDDKTDLGKKLLAQESGPLRSADLTTGKPIVYAAVRNLPFYADLYKGIFTAMLGKAFDEVYKATTTAVRDATGLDLDGDILARIGSEAAFVVSPQAAGSRSFPVLLYLQTTDRLAFGTSLQRMRLFLSSSEDIRFETKTLPEGRIYFTDVGDASFPFCPGWTFANDFLVAGERDVLKTPLYLARSMGTPLSATPAYREVTSIAPERVIGVFYLDFGRVIDLMKQIDPSEFRGGEPDEMKLVRALGTVSSAATLEPDAMGFRMVWKPDLRP